MSDFTLARNRDAYATICGFVYQIDLSIQRWLDLQPDKTIELERGEDIDLVSQLISPDCTDKGRILEQVKHRNKTITLRSAESLYAMACFYEHRVSNTEIKLNFRFVTNAEIGKERPCPFSERGIYIWRKCAANALSDAEKTDFLIALRGIIEHAKKPDELKKEAWDSFKSYISIDKELLSLIADFEWSTGETPATSLTETIIRELQSKNYAQNRNDAEELYYRFFLYIAKLLSIHGVKRLTVENRARVVQDYAKALHDRDSALLVSLKLFIDLVARDLQQRIDATAVAAAQDVESLRRKLDDFATSYDFATIRALNYGPPNTSIPDLPARLAFRSKTVENLIILLKSSTWVLVTGGASTGKTFLGALVAKKLGSTAVWLRLIGRSDNQDQAVTILHTGLLGATGVKISPDRATWYLDVCKKLGTRSLIIVDAPPRFSAKDILAEELRLLATACEKTGNLILILTSHPIQNNALYFGNGRIASILPIPLFSTDDIKELSKIYNAPNDWLADDYAIFLAGVSGQHAAIVSAVIEYIAANEWKLTKAAVDLLISKKPVNELRETIAHEVGEKIEDKLIREFLYRLSLYSVSFSTEDALAIARIQPEIDEPRHRFQKIIGPWIQKTAGGEYSISPLIRDLGSSELASPVKQATHLLIGDRLLKKEAPRFDQYTIGTIIGHFFQGGEPNRAGSLLGWALQQLDRADAASDAPLLVSLWAEVLPETMDLQIRIVIRIYQIKLLYSIGQSIQESVEHLSQLCLQTANSASWLTMLAVALVGAQIADTIGIIALFRIYAHGKKLLVTTTLSDDQCQSCISLIWHHVEKIRSLEELGAWVAIVEKLSPAEREKLKSGAIYESASLSMADSIWLAEASTEPKDQNWEAVLALLEAIAQHARRLNLDILWACAIRAAIIVKFEYLKNVSQGVAQAEDFLAKHKPQDPRMRFLIKECVGRNYAYAQLPDQAKAWMLATYQEPVPPSSFTPIRSHFLIEAAEQYKGDSLSVDMARCAVSILKEVASLTFSRELLKALGALSLALVLTNRMSESFKAMDEAVDSLLEEKNRDEEWKELFVRFGQIVGFVAHFSTFGSPPRMETGELYASFPISYIIWVKPAQGNRYDEKKSCFLMSQMALFAAAIKDYERSAYWALKAVEAARIVGEHLVIASAGNIGLVQAILGFRFNEAVDLAFDIGESMSLNRDERQKNPSASLLEDISGEEFAIQAVAIPLFIRVSILATNDPPMAREKSHELERLFAEIATKSTLADTWQALRKLLDITVLNPISLLAANRYIKEAMVKQPSDAMTTIVHVCGYIILSTSPNADLTTAFKLNCNIVSYFLEARETFANIRDLLFFPFIEAYWQKAITEQGFLFTNPRQTKQGIAAADTKSGHNRVLDILEAVSIGLPEAPPVNLSALRKK